MKTFTHIHNFNQINATFLETDRKQRPYFLWFIFEVFFQVWTKKDEKSRQKNQKMRVKYDQEKDQNSKKKTLTINPEIKSIHDYNHFEQMSTQQKSEMQKGTVSSEPVKNYYDILGLNQDATLRDIENSYQKLALKWHPEKHTVDRKLAERKFHEISEAYDVLSDANRRATYDQMISRQSSMENAMSTFDRFFGQTEMMNEEQEKFFEKNFPDRRKNYYKILGLNKDASMDDINNAYRQLSIKYHPRNCPNDEEAQRKFVQVNEAYQVLSNRVGRSTYDDLVFRQIVPRRSFDIFEDFFSDKWMDMPSETEFFRPIFSRRRPWENINRLMDTTRSEMERLERMPIQNIREGQSFYKEEKYEKKNGKENHTAQTVKRKIKNGQVEEEILKENILPNGEKDVMKTIKVGDKIVDEKKYHLGRGETMPLGLTN